MIKITYSCGGCFKEASQTRMPRRHFDSMDGSGTGFGVWRFDTIEDVAPEGWEVFDPYTGVTYCKECWGEIEGTNYSQDAVNQTGP